MKVVEFITSNKGKVEEVAQRLKPLGYKVVQRRYSYPEIQADTLQEVARFGIDYLISSCNIRDPVLIDDSGLFIEGLNGFPGVYSRYVLNTIGYRGILSIMKGMDNRKAYFETSLAYKESGSEIIFAMGKCRGEISGVALEGPHGFGFDPIFLPYLENDVLSPRSFSQMDIAEKNLYSHRSLAIGDLVDKLSKG